MMEMNYEECIDIDKILLDKKNPRLKPLLNRSYDSLDIKTCQHVLIYLLVMHHKVTELVEDMLSDSITCLEILKVDKIILLDYQSKINDRFIVKEGNRRICSFKIIRDKEILEKSYHFMDSNHFLSTEQLSDYRKEISKIGRIINNSSPTSITSINSVIYYNTEQSLNLLNNILRRMHINSKKTWTALEKSLYDYSEIKKVITESNENEISGLDDIYCKIAEDYYSIDDTVNEKKVVTGLRQEFPKTAVFYYLNELIEKEVKDVELQQIYYNLLYKRFRPFCDVLPKTIKKLLGIDFVISIKDNEIVRSFEIEKDDEVEYYIDNPKKVCEIIYIYSIKNDLHTDILKNKDLLKEAVIEEIKHLVKPKNEMTKEDESKSDEGIKEDIVHKPEIILSCERGATLDIRINDDVINLRNYIIKVYGLDGKIIENDKIVIKVRDKEENNPNNDFEESLIIDSQPQPIVKEILFEYVDNSNDNNPIRISNNFFINFRTLDKSPLKLKRKMLLPILVNNNMSISNSGIPNEIINELDTFMHNDYPYVSITLLRGFWECSIGELCRKGYGFSDFANMSNSVKEFEDHINNKLKIDGSSGERRKLAKYYQVDYVGLQTKGLLDPENESFLRVYKNLNPANHGYQDRYTKDEINKYATITSKWLYLVNYFIDTHLF